MLDGLMQEGPGGLPSTGGRGDRQVCREAADMLWQPWARKEGLGQT